MYIPKDEQTGRMRWVYSHNKLCVSTWNVVSVRGFAFVTFEHEKDAEAAIHAMDE